MSSTVLMFFELMIFWFTAVYTLYVISKYLKLGRHDFRTAFVTGFIGLVVSLMASFLFSGPSLRFILLVSYICLIKSIYGCGWRTSLQVLVRTAFFSAFIAIPLILLLYFLLGV